MVEPLRRLRQQRAGDADLALTGLPLAERDAVVAHYRRNYRPQDLVITAAGAVDHDALVARVIAGLEREGVNTEAMLRLHAPTTAQGVIEILRAHDPQQIGIAGDAFYSGANAGHSLIGALEQAGWEITFWNAHYHYGLSYQGGTERLRYVEGDVYTG